MSGKQTAAKQIGKFVRMKVDGAKLRARREDRGWSLNDVARRMNEMGYEKVSESIVFYWESRSEDILAGNFRGLCHLFRCEPEDLMSPYNEGDPRKHMSRKERTAARAAAGS
jgi:transcriptional regulator with XRE-family HTH domain